jgi:two-component system LytT family response regulator
MQKLKVLVVDDEPLALIRIRGLLAEIPAVEVVGAASGCSDGVQAVCRHNPDLILLDIRMRDGTAFDLLAALPGGAAPMIAFLTAYPRYAQQAFEVNALDYLLKPVSPDRLAQVVERAIRQRNLLSVEDRASELERIVQQLREDQVEQPSRYERELWIRNRGTEHIRVEIDSILRICALDDYVSIHTSLGQEHLLRATLESVEAILDPEKFARIHRSTIVRRDVVAKVVASRTGGRSAVLVDGTILPVGRTYARRLNWTSANA